MKARGHRGSRGGRGGGRGRATSTVNLAELYALTQYSLAAGRGKAKASAASVYTEEWGKMGQRRRNRVVGRRAIFH